MSHIVLLIGRYGKSKTLGVNATAMVAIVNAFV